MLEAGGDRVCNRTSPSAAANPSPSFGEGPSELAGSKVRAGRLSWHCPKSPCCRPHRADRVALGGSGTAWWLQKVADGPRCSHGLCRPGTVRPNTARARGLRLPQEFRTSRGPKLRGPGGAACYSGGGRRLRSFISSSPFQYLKLLSRCCINSGRSTKASQASNMSVMK